MTPPTGKEFCSFLERNGWTLARIKGSHHIYRNAAGTILVVPVHSGMPLKRGTFCGLLTQAGLRWP